MNNLRQYVEDDSRLKLEEALPALEPLNLNVLTKIELSVLYGIVMGADIEAIAKARCNSHHTIRNHLKSIYRKLKVKNARVLSIRYWRNVEQTQDLRQKLLHLLDRQGVVVNGQSQDLEECLWNLIRESKVA